MTGRPKIVTGCNIDGCVDAGYSRQMCRHHYNKWYRANRPQKPTPQQSARRRLWEKSAPEPNSGCWLWTGVSDKSGHGLIHHKGVTCRAHRVSWEVYCGPIPEGMYVLHKCDVPFCVNPRHLYIGDHRQNMRDMVDRGRSAKGERAARAKLTETQVLKIRKDERSYLGIAKEYGVSDLCVRWIKDRRSWRHI